MKNYFTLIFVLLLMSCNSDDTNSSSLSSAPTGALTKVEAYFPTNEVNYNSEYFYGSEGKISSAVTNSIQPGYDNTSSTVNFMINSDGQIWKTMSANFSHEFHFSNGLIISSIQASIPSGSITTVQYTYNSNNELIKSEYFDDNGVSGSVVIYTYDVNGNVLTKSTTTPSGNTKSYVYEYDTNYNPMSTMYTNQAFSKIVETSPNNKTKRTFNNNGTIIVFTTEYTYNADGYPVTETEYQNGNTLVEETTFTYQQ